ncbi:hypothetical protein FDW83_01280 [Pseudarthrobacter sp. NamE2]|uniref:hypothetical protein n=1 Tax=Pseudarthrobacter sp. NamE2 TaxID=2576838 RepID=UPI0010FEE2A7|nr:hypothetical protein [Pseudarthrobacter sp. NamE2]TLM86418.1 hypothetical protein FDW83_01280 [Pseudarthrobacter sp. NamE2]
MPLSPDRDNKQAVFPQLPQLLVPGIQKITTDEALRQAPGTPVVMLRPVPVRVRGATGYAIAYTVTHVLVAGPSDGGYQAWWEASWLVRKLRSADLREF